MSPSLPANPSLRHLKTQAKDLLNAHKEGASSAVNRLRILHGFAKKVDEKIVAAKVTLADCQFAIALEYGFAGWSDLKKHVTAKEKEMAAKNEKTPKSITEFKELADIWYLHSYAIQRVLREVDTRTLAMALSGAPHRIETCILRNMSERAGQMIRQDIEYLGQISQKDIEWARDQIIGIMNKLMAAGEIEMAGETKSRLARKSGGSSELRSMFEKEWDRPISQKNMEELVTFLRLISRASRQFAFLALEDLLERIDDEYLKMGLRLAVDGVEPARFEDIMESRRKTLVAAYDKRLEVMLTALKRIQAGDAPALVELACRALLPAES